MIVETAIIQSHLPCHDCGSSDALSLYADHSYCFSCKTKKPIKYGLDADPTLKNDTVFTLPPNTSYISWRGVTADTMRFYDVPFDGTRFYFNFGSRYISRELGIKKFSSHGNSSDIQLFGQRKFPKGSAGAITICEGALDAMSFFQISGSKYPCVSVRSASTAKTDCEISRNYLNSFSKIYIMFDNDNPGKEAVKEVSRLFDVNRVYNVEF